MEWREGRRGLGASRVWTSVLFCMTCSRVQVSDYFPFRSNLIFPLHRLCIHYRTCKLVEVRFPSIAFVNSHVSRNLANLAAREISK